MITAVLPRRPPSRWLECNQMSFDDEPLALLGTILNGADGAGPAGEGAVIVEGGRIACVLQKPDPASLPARQLRADYVAPGFIDLQVNGGFGHEVADDPSALLALARSLPATGVTTFLPTLVSRPAARYGRCFAAFDVARAATRVDPLSARPLGLHLEGPLLSPARAGAHDRAAIEAATASLLSQLADASRVALVTVAPERRDALMLITHLRARGIAVSLGHTDASFEMFTAAVDAGATLATHVWNAMSPLHHRAPGATGAALSDDRVTALAIADGVHTHPAAFTIALRAKGAERFGLVTDAVAAAGTPAGTVTALAGRPVITTGAGARLEARLEDGTLAGATLTMDQAVRNARRFAGLSPACAVHLATAVPARALGRLADGPLLRAGAAADLVLLDAELAVQATVIGGRLAYQRASAGAPGPDAGERPEAPARRR